VILHPDGYNHDKHGQNVEKKGHSDASGGHADGGDGGLTQRQKDGDHARPRVEGQYAGHMLKEKQGPLLKYARKRQHTRFIPQGLKRPIFRSKRGIRRQEEEEHLVKDEIDRHEGHGGGVHRSL